MDKKHALVLLETMYDGHGHGIVPDWFHISPGNFSGKRLYRMLKGFRFLVGNSCPQMGSDANSHNEPCPGHVARILNDIPIQFRAFQPKLIVVCGEVARRTFVKAWSSVNNKELRVLFMPHPAARCWTTKDFDNIGHLANSDLTGWRYNLQTHTAERFCEDFRPLTFGKRHTK